MTIVKSNICKQCGGLLDIDLDRQVYVCSYCGVTFDYEYFREDNVLELAKKALVRQEFGSSRDAYDYMLKKDPHNFEALRGLILCSWKWKSMKPLLQHKRVFMDKKNPQLVYAIEHCLPEHKDYFLKIQDSLEVMNSYRKNRAKLQNIDIKITDSEKQMREIRLAQFENNHAFTNAVSQFWDMSQDEGSGKLIGLVIEIGILIVAGLIWATASGAYAIPIMVAVVVGLIIGVYNIYKAIVNKSLELSAVPVQKGLDQLDLEREAIRREGEELLTQYNNLVTDILTNDPMPIRDTKEDEEPDDEEEN